MKTLHAMFADVLPKLAGDFASAEHVKTLQTVLPMEQAGCKDLISCFQSYPMCRQRLKCLVLEETGVPIPYVELPFEDILYEVEDEAGTTYDATLHGIEIMPPERVWEYLMTVDRVRILLSLGFLIFATRTTGGTYYFIHFDPITHAIKDALYIIYWHDLVVEDNIVIDLPDCMVTACNSLEGFLQNGHYYR